ncbi:MAG: hypothetical protein ACUVRM_01620 [Bacillota bacterium]
MTPDLEEAPVFYCKGRARPYPDEPHPRPRPPKEEGRHLEGQRVGISHARAAAEAGGLAEQLRGWFGRC